MNHTLDWRCRGTGFVGLLLVTGFPAGFAVRAASLGAQTPPGSNTTASPRLDSLRRGFLVRPPPVHLVTIQSYLGTPGSSLGSPAASGAASGDSFFGGSYQGRTRGTQDVDAEFGLGQGFGDPEGGVALEADLASFSTARHPPFTTGGVSFKLHHRVPEHLLLVAVGVEDAVSWGRRTAAEASTARSAASFCSGKTRTRRSASSVLRLASGMAASGRGATCKTARAG